MHSLSFKKVNNADRNAKVLRYLINYSELERLGYVKDGVSFWWHTSSLKDADGENVFIDKPLEECIEIIKNYQDEENLVEQVTSKNVWYSRTPNQICSIAVLDLGGKLNFIKRLNAIGCNVIIFPYNVTKEKILKYKPDGLFITSGPGNPKKLAGVIELVKSFIGEMPIFGVGLGCNILGLCYGAEVYKMKNGHSLEGLILKLKFQYLGHLM